MLAGEIQRDPAGNAEEMRLELSLVISSVCLQEAKSAKSAI